MNLDHVRVEPNIPLSLKVARLLRTRLRENFAHGGRIPGEIELAEQFGVSRGTLRQALSLLEREGSILRRQGDGTYANHYVLRIAARAENAYEFTELIRDTGLQAERKTVGVVHSLATEEEADQLMVEVGAPLLVVQKVFYADGSPAVFVIDRLPEALIKYPYEDEELERPIFTFLERRCHIRVEYMLAQIVPRAAKGQIAKLLQLEPGTPNLEFVETSYSDANEPVLLSSVYYSDSHIRFTVLRKKL